MKLRLVSFVLCSGAAPALAQQVLQAFSGNSGDRLGAAAIDAGDQDGDGLSDVLVGAPGRNSGAGAVLCVSGRFLATGQGASVIWSITSPPVNAGAAFGTALARVGNWTGDSAPDFVVGAPNYMPTGAFVPHGAVFVVDGTTHAVTTSVYGIPNTHFGQVLVCVGDQDGDFKQDIAVSAPEVSTVWTNVHVVPANVFIGNNPLAALPHWSKTVGWPDYGTALASGFDWNGDGKFDLAISTPSYGFSNPGAGFVEVCRADTFALLGGYASSQTGEHMGQSLDVTTDYDGDGKVELLAGAPNWTLGLGDETGRAVVISSAKLLNPNMPGPEELFELHDGGSAITPTTAHFGASVCARSDLNGDGVVDIVVGSPEYHTLFPFGPNKGMVSIFSGATHTRIGAVVGLSKDNFGSALVALDDLDGDGFRELACAGALSDNPTTDCGTLKGVRLFPTFPSTYCTAKVNSLGCTPSISWNGSASASAPTPFLITCSNQINQKQGFLMYSHAPNALPFQGGLQCVKAPVRRTPTQNSGGSTSGADCTGAFSLDFNARIQSGLDATLIVGAEVFTQYWSRDPQSPSATSLSNALRFLVNP